MKDEILPGINIQFPISELILNGKKTIETRTYPIPKKYINKNIYLIETPGKKGAFKARVTAVIKFKESFEYANKNQFYQDFSRHFVDSKSKWAWSEKGKWGWPVTLVKVLKQPKPLKNRHGIKFTSEVKI
jgi:hypothetical protein